MCGMRLPFGCDEALREAQAKLTQLGRGAFARFIIDTDALDQGGAEAQNEARLLSQDWAAQYLDLPVGFLGTVLQKYTILAVYPVLVPFVTAPFSPHDLMQTAQPLFPEAL